MSSSNRHDSGRLMRIAGMLVSIGAASLCLVLAASASAHVVRHLTYSNSIDGHDAVVSPNPTFKPGYFGEGINQIEVDQGARALYVISGQNNGRIYKFDLDTGLSAPFSGLAPSTVIKFQAGRGGLAIDDARERIYGFGTSTDLHAFTRAGLPDSSFPNQAVTGGLCGASVGPEGHLWVAVYLTGIVEVLPSGEPTGAVIHIGENEMCNFDMDSQGNFYVPVVDTGSVIKKYDHSGSFLYSLPNTPSNSLVVNRTDDSVYVIEGEIVTRYGSDGAVIDRFGAAEPRPLPEEDYPGLGGALGIAVDEQTEDVYVSNAYPRGQVDRFVPGPAHIAADASTGSPVPRPTSATLRGTVNADGVDTTNCYFEWGSTTAYGHKLDCAEGDVFTGSTDHPVSAEIAPGDLTLGSSYHVRLVVDNTDAGLSLGGDREFTAQDKPIVKRLSVSDVNTDGVQFKAQIDPNQGETRYRFEYGTDTGYGTVVPSPDGVLKSLATIATVGHFVSGLQPGQQYFYRVVAYNAAGTTEASSSFTTFPKNVVDSGCKNQLSRQQTGAALLPDCRSYELASAQDAGGYDVVSDLTPGGKPFGGYPAAEGRLLYGVQDGGIPGTGSPTNRGVDPYVATRGENGWSTKYVGIPADGTPSVSPFSSSLLAADQGLNVFAFGGPGLCKPCFSDNTQGIPVRNALGALTQGMKGSLDPGASAEPAGFVAEPLSADGTHLIFGSTSAFEADANAGTGDVSIYDRDLISGVTQVVSKSPTGANLICLQGPGTCHPPGNGNGIGELAVTPDGSRIVVAQKVATDGAGNVYWHPYMHIGSKPTTVDLAPGTTNGVLFDGMTADGSKVFLTSRDPLLPAEDTDTSADIYLAQVDSSGVASLELVSVGAGGPSNSDGCTPLIDWNTVAGGPNCDAVAFAGGGGVASGDGTLYFLSPELLDGASGTQGAANLYVVRPGSGPHFVVTMDTGEGKPEPPPPDRPVVNQQLISNLPFAGTLAANPTNGDVYVAYGGEVVKRFKPNGEPHNFAAGPGAGTNELPVGEFYGPQAQIAFDNHTGSLFEHDLYFSNYSGLAVFDDSGQQLGQIEGLGYVCGVSVDPSNGDVYAGDYEAGIVRLRPISNALPVTLANYEVTRIRTPRSRTCQVAADGAGHVFGNNNLVEGSEQIGPLKSYPTSAFAPGPGPSLEGKLVSNVVNAVTVDPSTGELFVDIGDGIEIYGPLGDFRGEVAKGIKGSGGVAVGPNHHLYVLNESKIIELGYVVHPFVPIDNPAVIHAVRQAGVRDSTDIQVDPAGRYAAFGSAVPINGFDPFGHLQVYRYDAQADAIACVSCASSETTKDSSLPAHGNGLTTDGRVFFNSSEPLVLRDTNRNEDPYEWREGKAYLLSTGTSPHPSGMLSVSASGRDAFFFTRDTLAPEDKNGALMKVYDAREDGGFFHIPDPPPCAASDECHGPGTVAAPAPSARSLNGANGNAPRCKRGFAKRRGKCSRVHRKRHPKRHAKRNGAGR